MLEIIINAKEISFPGGGALRRISKTTRILARLLADHFTLEKGRKTWSSAPLLLFLCVWRWFCGRCGQQAQETTSLGKEKVCFPEVLLVLARSCCDWPSPSAKEHVSDCGVTLVSKEVYSYRGSVLLVWWGSLGVIPVTGYFQSHRQSSVATGELELVHVFACTCLHGLAGQTFFYKSNRNKNFKRVLGTWVE